MFTLINIVLQMAYKNTKGTVLVIKAEPISILVYMDSN